MLTVKDLSDSKKLPIEFLISLGLKDTPQGVLIPYREFDGTEAARHRIRNVDKKGNRQFYWTEGEMNLIPYGEDRLKNDYSEDKTLYIVEGESDCWTLWHCDMNAIGLPGSSSFDLLKKEHLNNFNIICIFCEPDTSGFAFANKLRDHIKKITRGNKTLKVYVMYSDYLGYKDPSEAFVALGQQEFIVHFLRALMNAASQTTGDTTYTKRTVDMEYAFIAHLLSDDNFLLLSGIIMEDIYLIDPISKSIWEASVEIIKRGEKPNAFNVTDVLATKGKTPNVQQLILEYWNPKDDIQEIVRYMRRRANMERVRKTAVDIAAKAAAGDHEPELLAANGAKALVDAVTTRINTESLFCNGFVRGSEVADYVPTYIPELNRYYKFRPGHVIVGAGKTGSGKTTLLMSIHLDFALRGHKVLYISGEMTREELEEKALAWVSGIPLYKVQDGDFDPGVLETYADEMEKLRNNFYVVSDLLRMTELAEIMKSCGWPRFVCVDFLQMMIPDDERTTPAEQLKTMIRTIKRCAMESPMPVTISVLSQVTHDTSYANPDDPTSLVKTAGSTAIAWNANLVFEIYRQSNDSESAELRIQKNRAGPSGVIRLKFDGSLGTYVSDEMRRNEIMLRSDFDMVEE